MAAPGTIYVKTPAGLEEFRARALQLTRPQRNLLILIDGRSALGAFAKSMGCPLVELCGQADALSQLGLIAPAEGQAEAEAQPAASRQALVALAERIFGPRAGPLKLKLEKAAGDDPEQLLEAATVAAKLAKLTIDERKAEEFLREARRQIGV